MKIPVYFWNVLFIASHFLNTRETFHATKTSPNVSKTVSMLKVIDLTYQKLPQGFQRWRLQTKFGIRGH